MLRSVTDITPVVRTLSDLQMSAPRARLPAVRRVIPILVGVAIVAAGLYGLLAIFRDRDSSQLQSPASAQGPGTLEQEGQAGDPPTSGTPGSRNLVRENEVEDPELLHALAIGDVALVYGSRKPPPALERLRDDATGPFDPELAAAGQMAFLVRRPGVEGVEALAWQRRYRAASASDPQLRAFIDAWLGKGRGNTD